jgi:aminopeptidase N
VSSDADVRVIRLSDYQAPAYRISHTDLTFDLSDEATLVTSRLRIVRDPVTAAGTPLVLDGCELELVAIAVDGVALSSNAYRVEEESLTLFDLPATAEVSIVTRLHPERNAALEGLYKSGGMYCTQCEAEGFRRITYYLDRPDVLARFRTTLIADRERYPVLLSNGNAVADTRTNDGRRSVTWEDPFPKPSYLFALVAGDLALLEDVFETCSGRAVALRIYSEPHNIGQCEYAMGALKRAMRWDEVAYGREYDLDIFMIVAVDDFNMGAMENKGLNIFNTSCVLAHPDTATDLSYQRVEAIVAHEYFHNWSGNRVTCRDWFQLSLKEGFTVFRDAQFSGAMNSSTVKRIESVNLLRAVQFAEDSSPLAHPVRPASYLEISNFYTPTVYEKGSEVVGMLHTLLGAERFRAGSDLYFERHDGTAATTDDFLAAMSAASGLDLAQFSRWYEQAGTPVLNVSRVWQAGTLTLRITQHCPPTAGQPDKLPLHVPLLMGLLDGDGCDLVNAGLPTSSTDPVELRSDGAASSLLVHLRSPVCELKFAGLAECPTVSLLRGFSAPVRLVFAREPAELVFLAEHDTDGFARWDALQTLVVADVARRIAAPPEAGAGGDQTGSVLVDLLGRLLDRALEAPREAEPMAMLAAMLRLPDQNYLYEQFVPVDVDGIEAALAALHTEIAVTFQARWQALYTQNAAQGPYSPEPSEMARRSLQQVALGYLMWTLDAEAAGTLLAQHYATADNLTDRRAALLEATRHKILPGDLRKRLLEDFRQAWHQEALVINQWFSLQASSPAYDAGRVAALTSHPAFDARNPNKLRAVYGAFAQFNHRNFHARDGSGYRLLAEAVLQIDASNPQMAARLVTPLTRWHRYDGTRQPLMRVALEQIAAAAGLSKDVFEVVGKALAEV